MDPRKNAFLVFKENPLTKFSSGFIFDSALKTMDAQMFFWSVFLKTQKKFIDYQKRHFGLFWQLTFFGRFQKYRSNNICVSIVLKAKTEKNVEKKLVDPPKRAVLSFKIKTVNNIFLHVLGSNVRKMDSKKFQKICTVNKSKENLKTLLLVNAAI